MTSRQPRHAVDPLFLERWSPRAFDGGPMPHADLMILFEAAHWAPSAFNSQPWRFLYAHREGPDWDLFLSLLIPWNRQWAESASVLVYVLSDRMMETGKGEQPSHSHSFDAGAAWGFLALQATRLGYQAHGMSGVEFERAQAELKVPERFRIEAAIAVGRPGDPATLPEKLRAREVPSSRRQVEELVFAGRFPSDL